MATSKAASPAVASAGARPIIMAAVTATVLLSGPAITPFIRGVSATIAADTTAVTSEAAIPCASQGCSGPLKINAP